MALWKQFLIAAAAFFSGAITILIYMQIVLDRYFGQPVLYALTAEEVVAAVIILAAAFLIVNRSKSIRATQP